MRIRCETRSVLKLLAVGLLILSGVTAAFAASPQAVTLPPTQMLNDTATLNGEVNPGGEDTTAWFQWGVTTNYGQSTAALAVGSGTNLTAVSQGLSGLTPGITYYYRIAASNSVGVALGADRVFWSPKIELVGAALLTNECHYPFADPGTHMPMGIAAGYYHSLGLRADGTLLGWGRNDYGQATIPTSATNVVAIAAGYYHSLAVRADGTVDAWGRNNLGQTAVPAGATNVVAVAATAAFNLALRADGTVVRWGYSSYGQTNVPAGATNVVGIAVGSQHCLAVKGDGTVIGWGGNGYGQTTIPASATNVVSVKGGGYFSLALRADGTVLGWGDNGSGQTNIPPRATNVVAIAAGSSHCLALRGDGSVTAWGSHHLGQTTIPAGATNVAAIAADADYNLALRVDGTIIGWGNNSDGQTTIPFGYYGVSLPVTVTGTVEANAPDSYLLTYSVTNTLGGVGSVTRTVVVVDTLPPLLTLLGDNPMMLLEGDTFTDPGATAADLCGGDVSGSIVSNLTVNPSLVGIYTNSFSVTDAYGNVAQSNRTVIVVGRPEITSATLSSPGQFRLEATGTAGVSYTLQTSTNLVHWMHHTNVVASPEGLIHHVEDVVPTRPAWFYRLHWP